MHILFRVDANSEIGSGHIARCSVLANELTERGHSISLVTDCSDQNLIDKFSGLDASQIYWTKEIDTDLEALLPKGVHLDLLVVDHYALDESWERRQRSLATKILVIDDLANRAHECDFLLDQNFYQNSETRYQNLVPKECRQFCGPSFTLLRPEYRNLASGEAERKDQSALIFLGASDLANLSGRLAKILLDSLPELSIELLIGSLNPNAAELRKEFSKEPRVRIIEFQKALAPVLRRNTFGVVACGSVMWEAFACGLPIAVVTMTPEQKPLASGLADANLATYLGHSDNLNLQESVLAFAKNSESRFESASAAQELVDGAGVLRLVEGMGL